jgi:hypothetical protein
MSNISRFRRPEYCASCGRTDAVDIIDDDGPHKFYQCDRCGLTWHQYGFSGLPTIASYGSDNWRIIYRALTHIGWSKERAIRWLKKQNVRPKDLSVRALNMSIEKTSKKFKLRGNTGFWKKYDKKRRRQHGM